MCADGCMIPPLEIQIMVWHLEQHSKIYPMIGFVLFVE